MDQTKREWRVPRQVVAVKVAGTALFALAALWFSADTRFYVAVAATLVVGAFAVRDLVYPVRLTADARDGVEVARGLGGLRHIGWDEIVKIRIDERRRFGTVTTLLEIDVDATLILFGKHELGDDPAEVAATLLSLQQSADR